MGCGVDMVFRVLRTINLQFNATTATCRTPQNQFVIFCPKKDLTEACAAGLSNRGTHLRPQQPPSRVHSDLLGQLRTPWRGGRRQPGRPRRFPAYRTTPSEVLPAVHGRTRS